MRRRSELRRTGPPPRNTRLATVTPLRPQSRKKQASERRRVKAIRDHYGPMPVCHWPGCGYWASDSHHLLPRGRGGQDGPEHEVPLCRTHHDRAHDHPREAAELGLLLPSWGPDGGGVA